MYQHFYPAALIFLLFIGGLFLLVKRNRVLQRFTIDLDIGAPTLMWRILLAGGFIIIVFAILFKSANNKGLLKIEPDAFTKILNHYKDEKK